MSEIKFKIFSLINFYDGQYLLKSMKKAKAASYVLGRHAATKKRKTANFSIHFSRSALCICKMCDLCEIIYSDTFFNGLSHFFIVKKATKSDD